MSDALLCTREGIDRVQAALREQELDGWLLYASESPVAQAGRGLIFGGLYYPDGRRLASVAQEGLIRRLR